MANDFFAGVKIADQRQRERNGNASVSNNDIPIDKLIDYTDSDGLTNDDIFGPVTEESIMNLANGIKESGFKTAVEVWRLTEDNEGKYMIYSGHRRVAAAKYLNYTKVKCDVYEYPESEEQRRLQFLRANIHSRGSIKATSEGGDIYIAKQIKYLEKILRKQGVRTQTEVDKIVCKEFNAKKNTVWKYKSLLKACDELIEAESKGYILIEQAASLCVFDKEDQKAIVTAIMEYVEKGTKFLGKDLDALIKKLHEVDNIQDEDVHGNISISDVSSFIADILLSKAQEDKKDEEKKQDSMPESNKENVPLTVYNKYSIKLNSFKKDLLHNRIDDLKPAEVEDLITEYESIKSALDTAFLFSELMTGKYHGEEVHSSTIIDDEDLYKFNAVQLRKLERAYAKAEGLENIVSQISTVEEEAMMKQKKL